ncbi:Retrovirus-related pol polyprotein line-1, partial [Thalictrum thalictroides]
MAAPICIWNVRGINDITKAKEVNKVRLELGICLLSLIETKVKQEKYDRIRSLCCPGWRHTHNYANNPNGRVWLCWDPGIVNVTKLDESDQFLHCHITILSSSLEFILTSVYASNNPSCRLKLWADIVVLRSFVSLPWCVFGDFNNIISSSEKVGGDSVHPSQIQPFIDCLQQAGLSDLHFSGFHYTWCNNTLKKLKERLKSWAKTNGTCLHKRVQEAQKDLFQLQELLQNQPLNDSLADQERTAMRKYGTLARAEMAELRVKSDCMWMGLGDRCTAYFHNVIKERKNKSWIWSIISAQGMKLTKQDEVCEEFVKYYKDLMGSPATTSVTVDFFEQLNIN